MVVTKASDNRSYGEIEQTIRVRGLQTNIQRIESQPEETFTKARTKGLLAEGIPLARQQVRLAVAKGNPKKITTLSDLSRPEVRLLLCHPDAASIGTLCRRHLKDAWAPLQAKAVALKPTVTEAAADVSVGTPNVHRRQIERCLISEPVPRILDAVHPFSVWQRAVAARRHAG